MNSVSETIRRDAARPRRRQQSHRLYKSPRLNADMSCEEAFRLIARNCLKDLEANQEGTCGGDDEALHQMRIALTRLRAARRFFAPFVSEPEWGRLKDEFRWLNKHLSAARDMDVTIKELRSKGGGQREESSLHQAWLDSSMTSHHDLNQALLSERYRVLVREASLWVEKGQARPAQDNPEDNPQDDPQGEMPSEREDSSSVAPYAARTLSRWHKKLLKDSRSLGDMGRDERHQLRIRGKRLRYAIEFFSSLFQAENSSRDKLKSRDDLLKCLRKIQKSLGQLNDIEQGRSIAATLRAVPSERMKDHPFYSSSRKIEKRMIKAARTAFREMEEVEPFWA